MSQLLLTVFLGPVGRFHGFEFAVAAAAAALALAGHRPRARTPAGHGGEARASQAFRRRFGARGRANAPAHARHGMHMRGPRLELPALVP